MKELLLCAVILLLGKFIICNTTEEKNLEDKAIALDEAAAANDDDNQLESEQNRDAGVERQIRQGMMSCSCGKSNNVNKIVGGQQSGDHAWPWAAAIINTAGSGSSSVNVICGGSLICNRYILTAAHCTPTIMEDQSSFEIVLGDNRISNSSDPSRTVVGIDKIFPHPKYNNKTQDFDAALIRLNTTVKLSANLNPICLGQLGRPFVNRQATVIGWGTTFFGGTPVNDLRDTRLRVIRNDKCAEDFQGVDQPVTKNMICAYTEGKDTCQGDSGGPMFVNRTKMPEIFKQIGITSTGVGCAEGKPGIYTRVQRIISWIKYRTSDCGYCEDSFTP